MGAVSEDRPAELSVREGYLPPPSLPDGECVLTRLGDGSLRIDQADPRVLVSAELLTESLRYDAPKGVSLYVPLGSFSFTGSVLRIEGANRTAVYRIGEYLAPVNGYVAEWPD